jgi:hypothetical protein
MSSMLALALASCLCTNCTGFSYCAAAPSLFLLLPACIECQNLCQEGTFWSRHEQGKCPAQIVNSVQKGYLRKISRPEWVHSGGTHFGADAYFECTICSAIWTMVEPEREDNGLWERLA